MSLKLKNTAKFRNQRNYDEEPQFYPQPKRASTTGDKTNPRLTKQPKYIYKIPGPADYNLSGVMVDKQKAPSFSFTGSRWPLRNNPIYLDDGNIMFFDSYDIRPGPGIIDPDHCKQPLRGPYFSFGCRDDRVYCNRAHDPSPGPGAYSLEDNVTRTGPIPGYVCKYGAFDYSMSWRRQRNKYAVNEEGDESRRNLSEEL
ncbi:uncharacterized protein LOC121370999 [Gigantopelta aegis]|uniref:uncharacterized protein LOC121370999 n=1 Tax=Gigantopelta aegis TaxID=1735272 RepID=UPI001B88A39E|nr:uncharacterized protein LOC121370999 [Gigantopelta aegis]XP_041352524.1 uncharacterized protein LOC121370999 [Gigantopelta aegis]XP_041352525.1 uncharacterized protein LOC121370999 [Gigantopelta aegis]XP_041352526.1 uncharacterized protein LOC121370999 [Gigantopelta aegis]